MNLVDLICDGTCKFSLDGHTLEAWQSVIDGHKEIHEGDRQGFRFADRTDGFVDPEYSQDPSRPDLCERFCYWHANAEAHLGLQFSSHPFYKAVQRFETLMNCQAEAIYRRLRAHFGQSSKPSVRAHSYVQICAYGNHFADKSRRFLQDPHEDGHLFTIAKPTAPGLVILNGERLVQVELAANEAIIMTGSLLTSLTEDFIKPAIHAVERTSEANGRLSVLYFANPDPVQESQTWITARAIDMETQLRTRHTGFGNASLPLETPPGM